jgi:putative alpha-1,2-mannosidase
VWELSGNETYCMIGYHSVPVIVDAYQKGIRNFDVAKGYQLSKNSCERFGNGDLGHSYSISSTLEHAYFEWCLSVLADSLGIFSYWQVDMFSGAGTNSSEDTFS